jgi:hypothetical protein
MLPIPVAARSKVWDCGRLLAETVDSNPTGGMDVWCERCVLSGRSLCDKLITRPEESYRLRCDVVCDKETSWMRRTCLTGGCRTKNKQTKQFNVHGSVHRKNILIYIQQDATLHTLFYLETGLHVSGGTSTHHQKRRQGTRGSNVNRNTATYWG